MQVPILILNWNGWEDTFDCLRSLRDLPEADTVWLVDNCSTEDRSAEAAALLPGLRLLRWDDNYGYAGGNNRALRMAAQEGHRYAYLLNNDCEVTPGFLTTVVEAAETDPKLASVGSVIAFAEPAGFAQYDGDLHQPGEQPLGKLRGLRKVGHVSGAGTLIRLEAMEKEGYFDERLFCYCEDQEWCWRVQDRGWSNAVCGESVVVHRCSRSEVSANGHYYMARNQFIMAQRYSADRQRLGRDRAVYFGLSGVAQARAAGDVEREEAIAAGLRDGLLGRFGKRDQIPVDDAFRKRLNGMMLRARIRDKWRLMRGLKPGYPADERD